MEGLVFLIGLLYPALVALMVSGTRGGFNRRMEAAIEDRVSPLLLRITELEALLKRQDAHAPAPPSPVAETAPPPQEAVAAAPPPAPVVEPLVQRDFPDAVLPESMIDEAGGQIAASAAPASSWHEAYVQPDDSYDRAPPAWMIALKAKLFSGNLVAKFGLLILFIGVSFLLKYAAERVTIPIELRLAGVVLADLVLLGFGWRIRETRRGIALPVQGAALAILMLTVFGAFQRYQLIPGGMAFALLFGLTVSTCLLAVLQDAFWLAVFGICGGFAAPLMVSTGQGSHIALFSYYALLNAGVLAIAFKRSWRALNLLGFAFTFVIGTSWGVLKYQSADFLSAEGFLLLFFLFYVAVAIAWAGQQTKRAQAYVDATLVFATPLVAASLQYALVRGKPFGMALSVLVLAVLYTGLALRMWQRRGSSFTMLVESFLALGIVFGTLIVPFALDARWTSGAWALEGAAIVWIGLRQKQKLTWCFGLLVQAGAWISFIASLARLQGGAYVWLGFLLLAGAAFSMASSFRKQGTAEESKGFVTGANWLLALASLWLLGGAWGQLIVNDDTRVLLFVGSAMVVAVLLAALARSTAWRVARAFAIVAQLLAAGALFYLHNFFTHWQEDDAALASVVMVVVGSLVSCRYLDKFAEGPGPRVLSAAMMLMAAYCWYIDAAIILGFRTPILDPSSATMVGFALSSMAFAALARRLEWPQLRRLSTAVWLALPVWAGLLIDALRNNGTPIDSSMWFATAALWLAGDWLIRYWTGQGWTMSRLILAALHTVRTVCPLLMLWCSLPGGLAKRLYVGDRDAMELLGRAGWEMDSHWPAYLTAWLLNAVLFWLAGRTRDNRWPSAPDTTVYRNWLLPAAAVLSLCFAISTNFDSDGAVAPLPYLPLLNPVDLSTALALLLAARCLPAMTGMFALAPSQLEETAKIGLYIWFNLVLLRSAEQLLHIDYSWSSLFASQAVQAMLSLTWTLSALLLMRRAVKGAVRADRLRRWVTGALLLVCVVGKLFTVDLANSGSVARIVSFVGVGVLMLAIAYLAPFPPADAAPESAPEPEPAPPPSPA